MEAELPAVCRFCLMQTVSYIDPTKPASWHAKTCRRYRAAYPGEKIRESKPLPTPLTQDAGSTPNHGQTNPSDENGNASVQEPQHPPVAEGTAEPVQSTE